METSSSRALLTVRKLHSQMTFLLFWAMMLVAHGLPNMISGVNSIIFINMLAYPIPLPSILQQSEVLNLPELVTLPDRSKKEKALTWLSLQKILSKICVHCAIWKWLSPKEVFLIIQRSKRENRLKKSWISFYNFSFTPRDYNWNINGLWGILPAV